MRVYLGADHAGFEMKNVIAKHLTDAGHEVIDCGAHDYDPEDDYPAFCIEAAYRTVNDPGSLGIVLGGSGNGEQIAANKVKGARCALAWSPEIARLAREHNNDECIARTRFWQLSTPSFPKNGAKRNGINDALMSSPITKKQESPPTCQNNRHS